MGEYAYEYVPDYNSCENCNSISDNLQNYNGSQLCERCWGNAVHMGI
jgi:hypothetical protein